MQAADFWQQPQKSAPVLKKRRALERQKQLLDRGFNNVISADTLDQAEDLIQESPGNIILILELTPSWNKQAEIDFLNKIKKIHHSKLVLFLCTTEELNSDMQDQFKDMGISEFIFQRFDLEHFGEDLENAIQKHSPERLNLT